MVIGDRIREVRKASGLTQEGLARRAELTLKAIGELERSEVQDPHISSLAKIAHALHVEVADLLKEPAPLAAPAGAEGIFELLDRLGARTRHIADPGLIRSLETASGAAVMRTVRETRRELELLIPELQRLGDELEPASPGFMPHNKTLAWVSQQVLAFDFFLRSRDGEQPEEEAMRAVSRELLELALAG